MDEEKETKVEVNVNIIDEEQSPDKLKGAFVESLRRNNKQIRDDRAVSIFEEAQMMYERTIQDKRARLKKMARERANLLDMSPTNAQSLKLATDFDASKWVNDDLSLGLAMRNLQIEIELAESRYQYLFGEKA